MAANGSRIGLLVGLLQAARTRTSTRADPPTNSGIFARTGITNLPGRALAALVDVRRHMIRRSRHQRRGDTADQRHGHDGVPRPRSGRARPRRNAIVGNSPARRQCPTAQCAGLAVAGPQRGPRRTGIPGEAPPFVLAAVSDEAWHPAPSHDRDARAGSSPNGTWGFPSSGTAARSSVRRWTRRPAISARPGVAQPSGTNWPASSMWPVWTEPSGSNTRTLPVIRPRSSTYLPLPVGLRSIQALIPSRATAIPASITLALRHQSAETPPWPT